MILVRDVFRLQFGKSREAVAVWKEGLAMMKKAGISAQSVRLLTDLVGPYYTLVFESTHESLAAWEAFSRDGMSDPEWKAWYAKVGPLARDGHREIFNVVE